MGATHALSGLLVGAATAAAAPVDGWAGAVAWTLTVGGMARLPDLDSPGSSVGRAWGPVTGLAARGIAAVSGGHRWGTHDAVLAAVAFGLAARLALLHPVSRVVLVALAFTLAATSFRRYLPGRGWPAVLLLSVGVAWLATGAEVGWLPFAVVLGVWCHIVGDAVTEVGVPVPVWWLVAGRGAGSARVALPVLSTGGAVERRVVAPLLVLGLGWVVVSGVV